MSNKCDLKSWMTKNKLELKSSKTEFVLSMKPTDLKKIENSVIEIRSISNKIVPPQKGKINRKKNRNYF